MASMDGRNNRTQFFGKQARFFVNKFEAELPIGTRNGISQNIINCISVICNFKNISRKNTILGRCKKRKYFVIKHLRF